MKAPLDNGYFVVLNLIRENKSAPNEVAQAFMDLAQNKTTLNVTATRAFAIYMNVYKKEILESCLLAECTGKEIEDTLGIPANVVELYKEYFFDTAQFEDRLDRIEYAHNYPCSEHGKKLKKIAVDMGKECILLKHAKGNFEISAEKALQSIRGMAYMLSQMARINPVDSNISKEAFRWAQLCLRSTDDKGPTKAEGVEQLKIELITKTTTTNGSESGIDPEDILR
jgi:hypothetical protein